MCSSTTTTKNNFLSEFLIVFFVFKFLKFLNKKMEELKIKKIELETYELKLKGREEQLRKLEEKNAILEQLRLKKDEKRESEELILKQRQEIILKNEEEHEIRMKKEDEKRKSEELILKQRQEIILKREEEHEIRMKKEEEMILKKESEELILKQRQEMILKNEEEHEIRMKKEEEKRKSEELILKQRQEIILKREEEHKIRMKKEEEMILKREQLRQTEELKKGYEKQNDNKIESKKEHSNLFSTSVKQPLTALGHFSEYEREREKTKTGIFLTFHQLCKRWELLTHDEKIIFINKGKSDGFEFDGEHYLSNKRIIKKDEITLKEDPKKPLSAYMHFCKKERQNSSEKLTFFDLGEKWRNLKDKQKEEFIQQAKEDKSRFEKEKEVFQQEK